MTQSQKASTSTDNQMFKLEQTFGNSDFIVRTIANENGEIWFVAKDIAQALEYAETSNPARLFANVPDIWKGVKRIHTVSKGEQEMLCLTEQGLYFFLGRSDKPKALPYQMWIAGDVIPSIRKTGSYHVPHAKPDVRLTSGSVKLAAKIYRLAARAKNDRTFNSSDMFELKALDKLFESATGVSALKTAGLSH